VKALDNYSVGIYMRLSRDDGKHRQESLSIENQRRILQRDVGERGWSLAEEYVDDGVSGMRFDSPSLKRLFKDVQSRRVNCVIVKSLDRFGRGSQTEDVLDAHFLIPQVHFISLAESVDTLYGVDYLIDILHALNGFVPKTASLKVRQVKADGAQQGWFINSQAPYGYVKSPADRHKLIVDAEAAEVVRRIFEAYAAGNTARAVADSLTAAGLDSPKFYHYARAGKVNPLSDQRNHWLDAIVLSMLRNEVYIGSIVNGRREVASIKTKQVQARDESEWIVREGMHEAIIPRQLWDKVKAMLADKHRVYTSKRVGSVGMFAGLLRCKDCGGKLAYMTKPLKDGYKGVYRCSRYNNASHACTPHYVDEADLMAYVLNDVRRYGVLSVRERDRLMRRLTSYLRVSQDKGAAAIRADIKRAEERLGLLSGALRLLMRIE
jgi:DNA invertase Pin-like site-specific DNA recombinase